MPSTSHYQIRFVILYQRLYLTQLYELLGPFHRLRIVSQIFSQRGLFHRVVWTLSRSVGRSDDWECTDTTGE